MGNVCPPRERQRDARPNRIRTRNEATIMRVTTRGYIAITAAFLLVLGFAGWVEGL